MRRFIPHLQGMRKTICCILGVAFMGISLETHAQETDISATIAVDELIREGFENVRFIETADERIFTIENNVYKLRGVGIGKALELIQHAGLSTTKISKLIVTNYNVPQIALAYYPVASDSLQASVHPWDVTYDLGDSWEAVKNEKKKNSSLFKVDILIYPQLSFMNLVITQIYQVLFDLNPTVEVSLWPGGKVTGQVKVPVYNDGYSMLEDKIHPGFLTVSQRVRLPYNIIGKASFGYFNNDRWGFDMQAFYPFPDERFSLDARISYVGIGYWNGFHLHYDDLSTVTWSLGGNFYWPKYNTQFTLKGERYLLGEKGIKFEMIRHFRYASIGFYAMKAQGANSNGGFRFQVALPSYHRKRKGYIPRVNLSTMGLVYNAGNEQTYYKEFRAEASDNIMEKNGFNPFYINSELINY